MTNICDVRHIIPIGFRRIHNANKMYFQRNNDRKHVVPISSLKFQFISHYLFRMHFDAVYTEINKRLKWTSKEISFSILFSRCLLSMFSAISLVDWNWIHLNNINMFRVHNKCQFIIEINVENCLNKPIFIL